MPKYYFVDIIGKLNQNIFSGYIDVNDKDVITAFYDFSLPIEKDGSWSDVLLPKNTVSAYVCADNRFPFSSSGVNFKSKRLRTYFGSSSNTFGLYNASPGMMDYLLWTMDDTVTAQKYRVNIRSVLVPPCFKKGTKVLALNRYREEEYIPVEKITKGDMVKTYLHGFRRVEMVNRLYIINSNETPRTSMYKIQPTEDTESGLFKELTLTGEHSVLVDTLDKHVQREEFSCYGDVFDIDGKLCNHCCLSPDFIQLKESRLFECYHMELHDDGDYDKGFGIWANGLLVETPCHNEFVKERYIDIIHEHVKFIHSRSLQTSHVVWDDEDERWNVESIYKDERVEFRARNEADAVFRYVGDRNMEGNRTVSESGIEKTEVDAADMVRMKEEAESTMKNLMAEAENAKKELVAMKNVLAQSKVDMESMIRTIGDSTAEELLLSAKTDAEEARSMKHQATELLENAKSERDMLVEEKTRIENELQTLAESLSQTNRESGHVYDDVNKAKQELTLAIQSRIETEEEIKKVQSQCDLIIESKSELESDLLRIKQQADVAMDMVNQETKLVLESKETIEAELIVKQQEKSELDDQLTKAKAELDNTLELNKKEKQEIEERQKKAEMEAAEAEEVKKQAEAVAAEEARKQAEAVAAAEAAKKQAEAIAAEEARKQAEAAAAAEAAKKHAEAVEAARKQAEATAAAEAAKQVKMQYHKD